MSQGKSKQEKKFHSRGSTTYTGSNNNNNKKVQYKNVLNYQSYETLKVTNSNNKYYQQTDEQFIQDVRSIKKTRQNAIFNVLELNRSELSDKDCNQLDYRARIHSRANMINQNTSKKWESTDKEDRCYCGCRKSQGKLMPLCSNEQGFNVLGPGILLLFLFVKSVAVLLLICALIYSIFGFVTNLIGKRSILSADCLGQKYCSFKVYASDSNKNFQTIFYEIQYWLGLAFSVIVILGLRVIKLFGKQRDKIIDKKLRSSSDYALLIRNLPRGAYQQKQLISYFQGFWQKNIKIQKKQGQKIFQQVVKKNHFKIRAIQIIYNMQFSRDLTQKIFYLADQVDRLYIVKQQQGVKRNIVEKVQQYRQIKARLIETYQLLLDLRKKFLYDSQFRKGLSTTCCLMEFKSQNTRRLMLKQFGSERVGIMKRLNLKIKNFFFPRNRDIIFKQNVISIQRAPQPSDIMWENCQRPYSISRMVIIYSATSFIILVSFGLIIGIRYAQDYLKKNPQTSKSEILTVINIAVSVVILIVNKALWFSLEYLLRIQYNHTLTDKTVSQMNKTIFLNAVNSIGLPILTNYIILRRNFVYGNTGLSGFIFDYQLTAIVQLIPRFFNPLTIITKTLTTIRFFRYKLIRFLCSKSNSIDFKMGSPEVNSFYQGENFDIAQNYVHIISTILQAAFFCHLQPIIILFVSINVGLFYYVNKIKLVRLCKIPQMTQYLVFDTGVWMLGWIPILYGVGTISLTYFLSTDNPQYPFRLIPSLICMGLGFIALGNPGNILNNLTQYVLSKFYCINLGELLGQYDDDDAQQTQSQDTQSNQQMIFNRQQQVNKGKMSNNRKESYYQNSNALPLLGFELTLRGKDIKQVKKQLKMFCQSFFPKTTATNINVIQQLIKKQYNAIQSQTQRKYQKSTINLMLINSVFNQNSANKSQQDIKIKLTQTLN